jgi:hypothetical protein
MINPSEIYPPLLLALFAYAEIHYRLGPFTGLLFKKEPEIVFDLPFRSLIGNSIPLFLFIKDADRYRVKLEEILIQVIKQDQSSERKIQRDLRLEIKEKFFSQTFKLPAESFPTAGTYEVTAELRYEANGKRKHLAQDNYGLISHEPFQIYVAQDPLPSLDGWHWGDLHLHSNFTDDQVEFGAPIAETIQCARSLGLRFLAVTDHSFDLSDGSPSNTKWEALLAEIQDVGQKSNDFVVLSGEEVSAGNKDNQNVHCLLLGNRVFYPGSGDGAKKLLDNKPTLALRDLLKKVRGEDRQTITAAAHAGDIPPLSQKLVLNRGNWRIADLTDENLDYWQILNGKLDRFFLHALEEWKAALLRGHRIGVLAGTDAHGNFNCFRQIKIPLIKMVKHRQQLLGLTRSGVLIEDQIGPDALLEALRKKRVVISNGPIITIEILQSDKVFQIGDTVPTDSVVSVHLRVASSTEFGTLQKIYLYNGSTERNKEYRIPVDITTAVFSFEKVLDLSELKKGYLRAEVYSANENRHYFCLTNPIWIQ